ncbi:MAG: flagellar biosynthetic protein FliR [Myxococcota bacterium]
MDLNALIELVSAALPGVVLLSLRVGAVFAAMPAPFGAVAPVRVRAALTFVVALTIAWPTLGVAATELDTATGIFRAGVGEVFIGGVIGVTVRVILASILVAGSAIGFSSGLAFAQSVDPALGENMSPISRALSSLGIAFFLILEGHHVLLDALTASARVAPVGDAFAAISHAGVVAVSGDMVAHGLRIASPVVATMFIVQLGLALTSRAAPRVQIFQLTFAVAVSSGLLLLFVASPSLAPSMAAEIRRLPQLIATVLVAP